MQAADGNFYGTTYSGGAGNSNCTSGTCGTVFKMTPSGTLTTLDVFKLHGRRQSYRITDPGQRWNLVRDHRRGRELHQLLGWLWNSLEIDANRHADDVAQLRQGGWHIPNDTGPAPNGTFYGTTVRGGAYHACGGWCGTVHSLSVGLGPFVEVEPASGSVGP